MSDQSSGGVGWLVPSISVSVSLLVAALAIFRNLINERFKRHQSKIAVAAVLHAEISALMEITFAEDTVQLWTNLAERLEAGENVSIPQLHVPNLDRGPIFNANVDKLGLLQPSDARDVISFYEHLVGIRTILKNLVSGALDPLPAALPAKASQIRTGLHFWDNCRTISLRLLPSLERTVKRRFRWRRDAAD